MTKRDQSVETKSGIAAGEKRPYKTPQLVIYGTLAELTEGNNGSNLDPGGARTKNGNG